MSQEIDYNFKDNMSNMGSLDLGKDHLSIDFSK